MKTFQALDELEARLAGAGILPTCRRNDLNLAGFSDGGELLAMADGDVDVVVEEIAEPPSYELSQKAEIVYGVEGDEPAARLVKLKAAVAKLQAALLPGGEGFTSAIVEQTRIEGGVARDHFRREAGSPACETIRFTIALHVTASTPFG